MNKRPVPREASICHMLEWLSEEKGLYKFVENLEQYKNHKVLRRILELAYSPAIDFYRHTLPPGSVHGVDSWEFSQFNTTYHMLDFIIKNEKNKAIPKAKRDHIFRTFLSGISKDEFDLIHRFVVSKPIYGIRKDLVKKVFPEFFPENVKDTRESSVESDKEE